MKLENVDLKFNYLDGEREVVIHAQIDPKEGGYIQWGASNDKLGENVDLLQTISLAIGEAIGVPVEDE